METISKLHLSLTIILKRPGTAPWVRSFCGSTPWPSPSQGRGEDDGRGLTVMWLWGTPSSPSWHLCGALSAALGLRLQPLQLWLCGCLGPAAEAKEGGPCALGSRVAPSALHALHPSNSGARVGRMTSGCGPMHADSWALEVTGLFSKLPDGCC